MSAPALAWTNSQIYCYDNNTLTEVLSVNIVNTTNTSQVYNSSSYVMNTPCKDGCDNVTLSCAPPKYVQNIFLFGAFVVSVVVAILLLGRKRR